MSSTGVDAGRMVPVGLSTTMSNSSKCSSFPSLMCDENVDESGIDTFAKNGEDQNLRTADSIANAEQQRFGIAHMGNAVDDLIVQNSVKEISTSSGRYRGRKKLLTLNAQSHQKRDETTDNFNVQLFDNFLLESYSAENIQQITTDSDQPTEFHREMLLGDLSPEELKLLRGFPLSSGCYFSKSAVDRLAGFLEPSDDKKVSDLARVDVTDSLDVHQKMLAVGNDDAVKTFSAANVEANIENEQKISAKHLGRKIRARNLQARAGESRIQDILLHLLPAPVNNADQSETGTSQPYNNILKNFTMITARERGLQRTIDDMMLAIDLNGVCHQTNSKSHASSGEGGKNRNHRLAITADVITGSLDELIALVPPFSSNHGDGTTSAGASFYVKNGNTTAEISRSLISKQDAENSHVHTNKIQFGTSANKSDKTLDMPLLPDTNAYADFKNALCGDAAALAPVYQSPTHPAADVAQRVANLMRKCLTIEIPIRDTCTFQQVDLSTMLVHETSNKLAAQLILEAATVLSTVPTVPLEAETFGDVRQKENMPLHGVDAEQYESRNYSNGETRNKNILGTDLVVDVGFKATVSPDITTNRKLHADHDIELQQRPSKKRKLHADDEINMENRTSTFETFLAGSIGRGKRQRYQELSKPVSSVSLLKRLISEGVDDGSGACRPLTLLKTYQPPLNSFYDLIDATTTDSDAGLSLTDADKATRSLSNQVTAATILGTLESMQLIRSWFMAQLLAVREGTHAHIRLAKRQALLRKYYNHLISAYKLKKSAVRVREQTNIDFDSCKKESNRMLDRCKQALVMMFEDKRKLIELEKTLDIATNRYDLSRSVVSTRAARKTRGGPASAAASASANADAELLLSLGAAGASQTSSASMLPSTHSSSLLFGSAQQQHHHTLYPDHHDILGGSGGNASYLSSSSMFNSSYNTGQHFLTSASGRASMLHAADRNPLLTAASSRAGSFANSSQHPHNAFHRPQLLTSASLSFAAGSLTGPNNYNFGSSAMMTGTTAGMAGSNIVASGTAAAGGPDRPWLPTANTLLNFKKRRATTLSQLLKTEIDEADMLSDLAYLNGSSQTMQNSSVSKRKRQTAIKSNVRVDSNKLMIDEHAFHRNQTVVVEPNPMSSAAAAALAGAGFGTAGAEVGGANVGHFSATILSFSAGEIWLRRSMDGIKFRVSLGQLMDGTYKIIDTHYKRK